VFIDAGFPLSSYLLSGMAHSRDRVLLDETSFRRMDHRVLAEQFERHRVRWRLVSSRTFRWSRLLAAIARRRCVMTDPFCRAARLAPACEILPDGASTLLLQSRRGVEPRLKALAAGRLTSERAVRAGWVMLLGQNYVEFGALDRGQYAMYLGRLAALIPGRVDYVPHPREETRPEDLPPSFTWQPPTVPIELRLIDLPELPERILTFPSTAALSVPLLFPSVQVTAVDIDCAAVRDLGIPLGPGLIIRHQELADFIYDYAGRLGLPLQRMTLEDLS
jgi:hypothetical protein